MNAEIISNKLISPKFGYMELRCPEIASDPNAGRFFMISVTDINLSLDPMLKRPFAVCCVTSSDTFTFLYMIVGRGTALLAEMKPGRYLSITGPLGNYFKIEKNSNVALVAGGVGIAPILLAGRKLKEAGSKVTLYYGAKSKCDMLLYDELIASSDELIPVTDDGSAGIKGLVIDPLKKDVNKYKKVYACGPNRMLKAVSDICSMAGVNIEVSLDEQMGCGIGACLGCLIGIKENGKTVTKRCCIEGPIFNGAKVDWEYLIR